MKALAAVMPALWPSLHFFWNASQCDTIVLTDHFQYTKRSAATTSAPLQVSQSALRIPVKHLKTAAPVSEKVIDANSLWHKKHMHTIRHLFHNTPYAYYYLPTLEELFNQKETSLSDFLLNTTRQLMTWLGIKANLVRSSELFHTGSHETLLHNWCETFGCDTCLTEADILNKQFINRDVLKKAEILCRAFEPLPEYHILHSNRNLSILSFLMDYGPEAGYIIRQYLSS